MTTADVEPGERAVAGPSAEERPAGRLERLRTVERAWRLFVEDGADPAGIADEIARSWRRARGLGIDPAMRRIPAHLGADELAERRERDEILRLARPILEDFTRRLERGDQVLAYCDADGFMLSVDGAPGAVAGVEEIDFRPGACWAEAAAGTNGPGTALAEARPVEVFAAEHFVRAWQPWSCAAAPILAPGLATPVGVVDLTGPWARQRRGALIAAQAIARAIEERLRAAASVRDEVVRYAFRAAHASGDALVAVDGRGTVVAVNDAAARRRVVEAGALPAPVLAALRRALAGRELAEARELRLDAPGGPGLVVSPVTHERTLVGAILRAPLEARPGRRPRAAGAGRPPPPAVTPARYDFGRILGGSDTLAAAVDMARVASRNALPVVLAGESGTGKELFAHAIHADSDRRDGPFVAVNCGSIPSQLLEAELFGYEPGTFTGGRSDGNPGRFEDAHGGTLFLDEVSELSGAAQTALLRVVQEREVVRLGGSAPRAIDVRIVAATNKPLEEEIRAGRFRRDLYYRLNVLAIEVPPLRARGDDLVLLARIFLADAEADVGRTGLSLTPAAVEALRAHGWPGNVRELKNVMLRAAATARTAAIEPWELRLDAPLPRGDAGGAGAPAGAAPGARGGSPAPPRGEEGWVAPPGEKPDASPPAVDRPLRGAILDSEREIILAALGASGWNFSRTARRLGISRMTLYRRLHRCGISRAGRPG